MAGRPRRDDNPARQVRCPDRCRDGWLPCSHKRYEAHEFGHGKVKQHCPGPYPCPQCDGQGVKWVRS